MNLGATGNYPKGKLNETDEGELTFAITTDKKQKVVLLEFGKPVAWLGMTADDAEQIGNKLKEKAFELKKEEMLPDDLKDQIELFASSKIFAEDLPPVKFELNMPMIVGLISQLQLAFRHPQNVGPTRIHTEKLVRDLIEQIDPSHGDVYRFLMMGFNEAYDV